MQFLSLDIYSGKYQDFLTLIQNPQKKTLIFTPNPEILLRASRDPEFLTILRQADYLTPDANGLYTGSLIQRGVGYVQALFITLFDKSRLREEFGEIITGSNLTRDLVEYTQKERKKIMILDNYRIIEPQNPFEIRKMEIQSNFLELLREKFPELHVTLVFDGESTSSDLAKIIEAESIFAVFSCIGMKAQEARLIEIFSHLSEGQRVIGLGVGSSFDYLLGLQKRAPLILQQLGLEWLYRLLLSPSVRFQRIIDAVWRFPMMIQKSKQ